MLTTTPKVIRMAVCQRYFRIMEILKHWSVIGKKMGKRRQVECVGAKESRECSPALTAHLLRLEMWRCPEVGRTFRARREESEALRHVRGREWGPWICMRAFLLSTGRDEIGLERVLNEDMSGGLCTACVVCLHPRTEQNKREKKLN